MKSKELSQLVLEGKRGDQAAKEEILRRFNPLLIKYILKYFGINQDKEDLLQEGRVIILKAIMDFRVDLGVPFEAYLQKRTFYHYMDLRKKRLDLPILGGNVQEGTRPIDMLKSDQPLIEEKIVEKEELEKLQESITQLSPKQREVIQKYYLQGRSLRSMALKKDLCYQTLVKRKARAIKKLQEIYR